MEIKLNTNHEMLARAIQRSPSTQPPSPARDEAAFDNLQALNRKMDTIPVLRPEAVERAQQLISYADYPPEKVIRSLSNLIAAQWSDRKAE